MSAASCRIIAAGHDIPCGDLVGPVIDMDVIDTGVLPCFEEQEQVLHLHSCVVDDDRRRNRDMAPSAWRGAGVGP